MHFGKFLATLRAERGLTQDRLAERSGVSIGTIYRAEREEACELRRSSATAILSALDAAGLLSTTEKTTFIEAAGLSNLVALTQEHIERSMGPIIRAVEQATGAKSVHPARTEAHQIVDELCDSLGDAMALNVVKTLVHLRDMYATGTTPSTAKATPRQLDVVHPPEQREGYSEQRITTYRVEPPPSKGDAKKKRG